MSKLKTATAPAPQLQGHVLPAATERTTAHPVGHRVQLLCPTPLLENPLEIEIADPAEAQKEFCRINGISGSEHPWKIEPLYA